MKKIKSIIQQEKSCYICKTTFNLHKHHIFFGTANRRLSESDGLTVYLCQNHHTGKDGVHFNKSLDLELKQRAERAYLEKNNATIEDFIKRYGKNCI